MPNSLSVQPYPVPGVEIVPTTYGAGPYACIVVETLPTAAALWFVAALRGATPRTWIFWGLTISAFTFLVGMVFLYKLSLEITQDGLSYTSLFGGRKFVAYPEISSAVLIDYRHLDSEATPRRTLRSWTAVITPKIETGSPALKIPLTLFPESARREIVRILQPARWESGI